MQNTYLTFRFGDTRDPTFQSVVLVNRSPTFGPQDTAFRKGSWYSIL